MQTCPACGVISHDADEKCSECGRNFATGHIRNDSRRAAAIKPPVPVTQIVLTVVLAVPFLFVLRGCLESKPAPPPKPDVVRTVTGPGFCGPKTVVSEFYRAAAEDDRRGYDTMSGKPGVFPVNPGDRAEGNSESGGFTIVTMLSGAARSETCWIPTSLLK